MKTARGLEHAADWLFRQCPEHFASVDDTAAAIAAGEADPAALTAQLKPVDPANPLGEQHPAGESETATKPPAGPPPAGESGSSSEPATT